MPEKLLAHTEPLHRITLIFLLLVPFCAAKGGDYHDWNYEETRSDARDFAAGGMLHVRLSVGDLHIKRGAANRIQLRYTVKSRHESGLKDTTTDFEIRGNDATLEFHIPGGGNTNIDAELEVPANTNLDVHEKVGDITIDNIEGNKDLELGVGDIRITDEHAQDHSGYRLVRANAGIGDVNGDGYGETSGWLGKTLRYRGEGKYELRAHVGVGDIRLEGK
jgi:hypothetical protein